MSEEHNPSEIVVVGGIRHFCHIFIHEIDIDGCLSVKVEKSNVTGYRYPNLRAYLIEILKSAPPCARLVVYKVETIFEHGEEQEDYNVVFDATGDI